MKKILITITIISGFSLIVSMAQAQTIPARGPVAFATYDNDGNGAISEQEFNTIREQRQATARNSSGMGRGMAYAPAFADIDTDQNGQISAQELQVVQQQQQANRGSGRGLGRGKR